MDKSETKILNSGKMSTIQLELTKPKPNSTATKYNSTTRIEDYQKNELNFRVTGMQKQV